MAKKNKKEDAPAGSPAWMATFSDLMNLLLCFFVLLFAMSSPDQAKFEQIVESLSSAFSFFDGGASSIGDGQLINMGTAQLNELDEYYSNMGQSSAETGDQIQNFEKALEDIKQQEAEEMLDEISSMTSNYNLDSYVNLEVDEDGYDFVMITMSGNLLFDSGQAEIKKDMIPVLSKVGDILKEYDDNHRIAIIGYTDTVKINTVRFPNNRYLSSARAIATATYLTEVKGLNEDKVEYTGRGETNPVAENTTEEGRAKNRRIEIRIYNSLSSN